MKNPSGNKLDKLVFGMFDQMVEGADKYVTEQGSTWLIFTDEKRWIIEFTEDRILWFNYNLFQSEFELIGKDCIEDGDLIKNWFESRFLNKPKVDEIWDNSANMYFHIEDAIQNGVKGTDFSLIDPIKSIEDTIQNGVKDTQMMALVRATTVEDTIQNGVKDTRLSFQSLSYQVGGIIQNGVKHTMSSIGDWRRTVEDTIQNGVKNTRHWTRNHLDSLEDTIKHGEKIELK
jgi:hypothetical protein